jgi:hypothetical protein
MKNLLLFVLVLFYGLQSNIIKSQELDISDPWLLIKAEGDDPLYTTYTAAMERSRLYGDKGYKMDYWSGDKAVCIASGK